MIWWMSGYFPSPCSVESVSYEDGIFRIVPVDQEVRVLRIYVTSLPKGLAHRIPVERSDISWLEWTRNADCRVSRWPPLPLLYEGRSRALTREWTQGLWERSVPRSGICLVSFRYWVWSGTTGREICHIAQLIEHNMICIATTVNIRLTSNSTTNLTICTLYIIGFLKDKKSINARNGQKLKPHYSIPYRPKPEATPRARRT